MLGSLYFIQEGSAGCIKIGWTGKELGRRVHNLQIGNSDPLTLIAALHDVQKTVEAEWHARFAPLCKRGEWFYPQPPLMDAITALKGSERPWRADHLSASDEARITPLLKWMCRNRLKQESLADRANVARQEIFDYFACERDLSLGAARRIEILTGGEIKASQLVGLAEAA